jgi:DNA replication protein DnaC
MGGYGVGKTHLAAAIGNHRLAIGEPVLFQVVPDLLDHLRAAYAPGSEAGYDELFESIRQVPLLILDDLGTQISTQWAQEKLFQLLNHRHNFELPTVITTNNSLDEIGGRLASRMSDPQISTCVTIDAVDFRGGGDNRSRADRAPERATRRSRGSRSGIEFTDRL